MSNGETSSDYRDRSEGGCPDFTCEVDWLDDAGRMLRKERAPYWVYYMDASRLSELDPGQVGKWMSFFSDVEYMAGICRDAVFQGACIECKHSHPMAVQMGSGVACFYVNGGDKAAHRRLLAWMLEHDLIRRTKSGRFYNIGFKYDAQTIAGEYGDAFTPKIVLSDFVDLETGLFVE